MADGAEAPRALASRARLDEATAAHTALDARDPLREFRSRFLLPTPAAGESCDRFIYFDGNSLGLQPKSAADAVRDAMGDWSMQSASVAFGPGGVGCVEPQAVAPPAACCLLPLPPPPPPSLMGCVCSACAAMEAWRVDATRCRLSAPVWPCPWSVRRAPRRSAG